MVYYDLLLRVVAENVTSIGIDNVNYSWILEVKCNCGNVHTAEFTETDEVEAESSKSGTFNFIKKCKECNQTMTISVYNKSAKNIDCNKQKQLFCTFDCRNCTPVNWKPSPGLVLVSESGSTFKDVELSEDWTEYDEKGEYPLSIEKWEIEFERNKNLK